MWPTVAASRQCAECGWDVAGRPDADLAGLLDAEGDAWAAVLEDAPLAGLRWRPDPETWTGLEYAAHVRGVLTVFAERVVRMLGEEDPVLVVWDDEAAVLAEAYDEQDPAEVLDGLQVAAGAYGEQLVELPGEMWSRTGRREDTVFTVSSISWYGLHESTHHRFDVERSLQQAAEAGS